ncbi:TetR/AcrR family transcriptional regulator [Aquimarina sp. 2201CG5-10]|uniref:TetR/AcrR family transcriptional regulator n=1 Tax=Aquimarina callyspongiae TaxID=3098150 RepID=UPI002AB377E5|nr:TetR/AcrR family transcriptional regulator [Aquimarina sp. 2201CG5-10]MDY8135654.1 TetR/AcrR family transcriptional regulator [Aquimarina sp. 2201CG5-10]
MARKKEYIEEEVIEKAMELFWRNGYQTTSMQMLEKEMEINKFSIYASFGNKNGVFLESIKCYKQKLGQIINKLKASQNGIVGLKQYFYDFIEFSKEMRYGKGCLITNTANEIGEDADPAIKEALNKFTNDIRNVFADNLKQENKDSLVLEKQADYLLISMFGLASASRVFNKEQLKNYIENVFKSL